MCMPRCRVLDFKRLAFQVCVVETAGALLVLMLMFKENGE